LQLTHLPSSDWIALLLLELERAIGCDLADDGARQELLLDAKREQMMAVRRVHVALRRRQHVHPATRLHVERAARLQRALRAPFFQFGRRNGPVRRKTIDDEILEPHGCLARAPPRSTCNVSSVRCEKETGV